MISKIRDRLAVLLFDLAWIVAPGPATWGDVEEWDDADIWPCGYGLAISRAAVASWAGHPGFAPPEIEPAIDVDHAGARLITKALLAGLLLTVAACGGAWLVSHALHALGMV